MGKFFKHNEKTDFIVNMKETTYRKIVFSFLVLFVAALTVSYLPYFFAKGNALEYSGVESMQASISYSMENGEALKKLETAIVSLMAFGFCGFLLLLIAGVKKYLTVRQSMPLIMLAVYGGICAVSMFLADDVRTSFFGNDGRYGGMVTIISCIGVFAAALQLEKSSLRRLVCDVAVVFFAVNCAVGILQALPVVSAYIPGFFSEATFLEIISIDHLIANGICGSPFALCSYAVMGTGICLVGIMYCERIKKRIFYMVCMAICLCGGLLTKLTAVLVGIAAVMIFALIIEIVRLKSGHGLMMKGLLANPLGKLLCAFVFCAVVTGVFSAFGYYGFYESYIASTDSLSRLMVSNPRYSADGAGFYLQNWKDGLKVLKDNWIFGVGPDAVAGSVYQADELISEAGSTDVYYNEYLHIAATTGIPSLVCFIGFIILACKRGCEGVGRFFAKSEGYERAASFVACAGYCAAACFLVPTAASQPLFFLFAGLAASAAEKTAEGKKSKK